MAVSSSVKTGRPSAGWYVVAKNNINETGHRASFGYSRSCRNEEDARKMAEELIKTSQSVFIHHGWGCATHVLTRKGWRALVPRKP